MKSPFDLNHQNQNIEGKIVVALERISEAFRVLLWDESKATSLSPIQIQILIFLRFHTEEMCTISHLAREFNMTKPTVSDSVRVLLQKKLVERSKSPVDTRSYIISLTESGIKTADQSANFAHTIEQPLHTLSSKQKKAMLSGMLQLIKELNRTGVITV